MFPAKWMAGSALAVVLAGAGTAQADVVISKKATVNMSCAGGVCSPTATSAVLNATDLTNMLASGDVTVITGRGATNIVVKDGFSWTSTSRLTLDAMQSVEFDKPVSAAGSGAVTITTNDGGSGGDLLFDGKGNLTFWDLSSNLIVNGNSYTLAGNIQTLAADIGANPSGFYALANDYDASVDGTYSSAPITTEFDGTFEGMGHKIERLTIAASGANLGLFAIARGVLRDVRVLDASISGDTDSAGVLLSGGIPVQIVNCTATGNITLSGNSAAGGLVSGADGDISRSNAAVKISIAGAARAGGLVGYTGGVGLSISFSSATGNLSGGDNSVTGGLVGSFGTPTSKIDQSYASGSVTGGESSQVGGLIGTGGGGTLTNAYATGAVKGGKTADVGGFAGEIGSLTLQFSYSTGPVKGGQRNISRGGFVRSTLGGDQLADDYWDKETSGQNQGFGKCRDPNCGRAVHGLTTEEFQSGLPQGFDPSIWGEKKSINGGFPYLLGIPPR
jgi:hypothetical protein